MFSSTTENSLNDTNMDSKKDDGAALAGSTASLGSPQNKVTYEVDPGKHSRESLNVT